MNSRIAIKVNSVEKIYEIYDRPENRLKQFFLPRLQKLFGLQPKSYKKDFQALKEISLEIKKGDTVGIIGRNGAGKSTLLQIICGTLTPSHGEIEITGRVAALLELGSGFNPEFTGHENIYMNASILGLSKPEIEKKYSDIIKFADIGEFIDQPVKNYSSGMLVRLAFAVVAHVDADILIIDEALSVGEVFFTQKCMRFLRAFMKTGTVLFVSHDTSSIQSLCDRAIWIDKGTIIEDGSPKTVSENYLEAKFESIQGKEENSQLGKKLIKPEIFKTYDIRQDFLNTTTLRNDIQLFNFDPEAKSFGALGAKITNVYLSKKDGTQLSWCIGGEQTILNIKGVALKNIESIIVGFFVRDRLGQDLFGDNTFISYFDKPLHLEENEVFSAEFKFVMPRLPAGSYSIAAAIATGNQEEHVQQHWIHEALSFQSTKSNVSSGLIGIQMHTIELTKSKGNYA